MSLSRKIAAEVDDLVKTGAPPRSVTVAEGTHTFDLPVSTPPVTVSMLWHPRMEADPAHRWLRRWVHDVCAL